LKYDSDSNRKTQTTSFGGITSTTTYNYDHADRLMDVDGVTYVYDNNGKLKNANDCIALGFEVC
jgi:hypothetical protein